MSLETPGWQPHAEVICPCGHIVDDHDRIALRYCAATASGHLSRGCVCVPAHDLARVSY